MLENSSLEARRRVQRSRNNLTATKTSHRKPAIQSRLEAYLNFSQDFNQHIDHSKNIDGKEASLLVERILAHRNVAVIRGNDGKGTSI